MVAVVDRTASMPELEPSDLDHFALRRWYTPLPAIHVRLFPHEIRHMHR